MKVFSLARFYYDLRKHDVSFKSIKASMSWANRCHGLPVVKGLVTTPELTRMSCKDEWTKEA